MEEQTPPITQIQPSTWQSSTGPSRRTRSDTCWGGMRGEHPRLQLG